MMRSRFLARILLRKAWPRTGGTITGLPLNGTAEVIRDRWGIPHIFAGTLHDLFAAQGFVHAQDRLWQMESLRRLSEGRLAEVAGPQALNIDCFARLIGMPFMKRQMLAAATDEERGFLQDYADGVNGYIAQRGKDLPLEFTSMRFTPEPWTALDNLSSVPYLAWFLLAAAYSERLLALVRGRSLSAREWNDMFPVAPHTVLPEDPYFESLAHLRMGVLHPCATAFHLGLPDTPASSTGETLTAGARRAPAATTGSLPGAPTARRSWPTTRTWA